MQVQTTAILLLKWLTLQLKIALLLLLTLLLLLQLLTLLLSRRLKHRQVKRKKACGYLPAGPFCIRSGEWQQAIRPT